MTNDNADSTNGPSARQSSGIPGLDEVLFGGFIPRRSYLVRGDPGTGKTILGLHFLSAGIDVGETSLFINLEETTEDITANATALDLDLGEVRFLDLSPGSEEFVERRNYDVFVPSEVERDPLTETIAERITEVDPDRVFVDPLSRLRHLAPDDYQFRKQTLAFVRLLRERGATVLFTSQSSGGVRDDDLPYMSDGNLDLEFDATGRSIRIPKFRGSNALNGPHAMRITDTGLTVYPALHPDRYRRPYEDDVISSGVPELDKLVNGGIERGTISIISGPTGVGKTTTGTQFVTAAAARGERSVIYLFEESTETFLARSAAIDLPVHRMLDGDTLSLVEVEPLRLSPQMFARMVRREVEDRGSKIVMIDGIDGYKLSLRGKEGDLIPRLHALNRYLKNMGVAVILIDEITDITGDFQATEVGVSYLADNIVFLRHLEYKGELRKTIGVLKKRTTDFERTLREFTITKRGVEVGEPLTDLRGILNGTPTWTDTDRRPPAGDE